MKQTKDIQQTLTTETFLLFWRYLPKGQVFCGYTDLVSGFGNCLYADSGRRPLTIKLYSTDRRDPRVAYLTVAGHQVQWRYGRKELGFARCPIVNDPALTDRLDGLFVAYATRYFQHPLFVEGSEGEDYPYNGHVKGGGS